MLRILRLLPISKVYACVTAFTRVHHTLGTRSKEMSVATAPWETTFDLIGLTAYITLMTGELPDSKLLTVAREGPRLREVKLPRKSRAKATTDARRATAGRREAAA